MRSDRDLTDDRRTQPVNLVKKHEDNPFEGYVTRNAREAKAPCSRFALFIAQQ